MRLSAFLLAVTWFASCSHSAPVVKELSGAAIIENILSIPDTAAAGWVPYIFGGANVEAPLSWAGMCCARTQMM